MNMDMSNSSDYVTQRRGNPSSGPVTHEDMQRYENRIISRLDSWFEKYDGKFTQITNDLDDVKNSLQFMSDKYEHLNKKSQEIEQRVEILERKDKRAEELESKVDMMEQQARQCNLEISNLPERRGEDLLMTLMEIGTVLKCPLSKQDIVSVHRVPSPDPKRSRPKNVIVKFNNRMLRDSFVASARLAKGIRSDQLGITGPGQQIFINEHLTLKNKGLFREVREATKKCAYRYAWIKHGTILVRKSDASPVIAIRSRSDLCKIKNV